MSEVEARGGVNFSHYKAEAEFLTKTLEDGKLSEFQQALHDDSRMNPLQFKKLVAQVNDNLADDACRDRSLPNLSIKDEGRNLSVFQDKDLVKEIQKARPNNSDLDARLDSPVPKLGEILVKDKFCSKPEVEDALRTQKQQDAAGEPHRLLGQILVDKGICTRDQVEQAFKTQNDIKADKLRAEGEENSLSMPLHKGEGYFQMVQRLNPQMSDEDAVKYSHTLKHINGERTDLGEGEQIKVKPASD